MNLYYEEATKRFSNLFSIFKLQMTVYNYKGLVALHGKYTICRRPSINLTPWVF